MAIFYNVTEFMPESYQGCGYSNTMIGLEEDKRGKKIWMRGKIL